MTLKAMSRDLARASPTITPSFVAIVKRPDPGGEAARSAKDKTLSLPDRSGMIVGLFRRSAKGFGFVRPHSADRGIDQIYIPQEATRDASSGDEVAVKITSVRPGRAG